MNERQRLDQAVDFLRGQIGEVPPISLTLGSGLSEALGKLDGEVRLPFNQVPNFPQPTVAGHAGELVFGQLEGKAVAIQQGRVHYYEGRSMDEIVFALRVLRLLGVRCLIVTNAAGGINRGYRLGDFVLIRDHINALPDNPLRGPNIDELGTRFPSMIDAYSPRLRLLAKQVGRELGLRLREAVYVAAPGPMYETPAEIKAYKIMGADLVGMSTVPEVIAARHCGLEVLGISVVTNMAAGIGRSQLSHDEVLETTKRRERDFARLLKHIVRRL